MYSISCCRLVQDIFTLALVHQPCVLVLDDMQEFVATSDGCREHFENIEEELLDQMEGDNHFTSVFVLFSSNQTCQCANKTQTEATAGLMK